LFRQETNIKKTCSKQNEVMNGEKKKKKDEEIVFLREMVAELGDKVHQLQQELAIATTSKTVTTTTAAATATNAMTAMTMMDHKGKENEHKGLVSPASFRPGNKRALERNHSMYSEGSVMDTMEPFLDYYDSKQGVLARPKWVTKYPKLGNDSPRRRSDGGEKPQREQRSSMWPFRRFNSTVTNSNEMIDHYSKISLLGKALKLCQQLNWRENMYHPLTKRFKSTSIPRVTLAAIDKALKDSGPVTLRILKDYDEEGAGNWGDLEFDTIWANKAGLQHWGLQTLEQLVDFSDQRGTKKARFVHYILEACNNLALEELDAQPTRHMYYHYGSEVGVKKEANILILQVSPLLVQVDDKVFYGFLYEHDACQKYSREVMDTVSRSHAVFRYTETALTIFTSCGIILQQNPLSCTFFGIAASENTMYSDFCSDGKPVNRLRALFGNKQALYDSMLETIEQKNSVWSQRMKVRRCDLRPLDQESNKKVQRSVSFDDDPVSSDRPEVEEDLDSDGSRWFQMSFNKFSDPADGKTAIFCEMKDVTKVVLQEQKLSKAKRSEHELLKSIIPKHIIQHLLEEKSSESHQLIRQNSGIVRQNSGFSRSVSFRRCTSFSSQDSDKYLEMSALRMITDKRVGAMAEHHKQVTVCFADIVGFTRISSESSPGDVMIMLNRLFSIFDDISEYHNIYKVETIGDAYMSVAGLNLKSDTEKGLRECGESKHHASRMIAFCKDILDGATSVLTPMNSPVEIRIGVHTGDVMTGVVGYKMPRFCLFGDTVNVASRMESTGKPGHIHASDATRDLAPNEDWEPTGGVEVKGKGLIHTFLLKPS